MPSGQTSSDSPVHHCSLVKFSARSQLLTLHKTCLVCIDTQASLSGLESWQLVGCEQGREWLLTGMTWEISLGKWQSHRQGLKMSRTSSIGCISPVAIGTILNIPVIASFCLLSAPHTSVGNIYVFLEAFYGEALRIPEGSSFEITEGWFHDDNVFHYSEFLGHEKIVWHFFHKVTFWGFTFMYKYSALGSVFNFSIKFLCRAKLAVQTYSISVIFAHPNYSFSQPSKGTCFPTYR